MKYLKIIILLLLLVPSNVFADTHTAGSCSITDINTAMTAASAGDTVSVPAGDCTWETGIIITKGIQLIGAGSGSSGTNITRHASNTSNPLIAVRPANYSDVTNLYRVSGFSFNHNEVNVSSYYSSLISIGHDYKAWTIDTPALPKFRLDHCILTNPTATTDTGTNAIISFGTMQGVIDNNTFSNIGFVARHNGGYTGGTAAMIAGWMDYVYPHMIAGSDMKLYWEDNVITDVNFGDGSGQIADCDSGGSYSFRYNSISFANTGDLTQGLDAHGWARTTQPGCTGMEVYGNTWSYVNGNEFNILVLTRDGSNFVFHNQTADNGTITPTAVQYYHDDFAPCPEDTNAAYVTKLIHDSYSWCNRDGATGGLLNATSMGGSYIQNCNGLTNIPTEGRDFFDDTTDSGVRCGTLANLPTTCTTGQGYWATNQSCTNLTGMVGANPSTPISGTLYKCTATNTWTSFYTPYEYPHPLRGETVATNYSISGGTISGGSIK